MSSSPIIRDGKLIGAVTLGGRNASSKFAFFLPIGSLM